MNSVRIRCEPNSVFSWLDLWKVLNSRNPAPQTRKITGSKPQEKRSSYAMETESGRSKRSVRWNSTSGVDSGSSTIADHEKPKLILRKFCSPTVDSATENPQSELEKVKRNLRKVSNSTAENNGHLEVEVDKSPPNLKQLSSENQKNGERRASFAAKSDYEENVIQTTPNPLPSYMATAQSAKANHS
ncbi:hypothetical protein KSP39_PZI012616 [Platanthera zijinensis]|uniref:Uncharacterized protein n=1 Tax=Platanthera zijinensis TaxID=2320716 RepID=A0AAP0G4I0_9ASPA